MGNPSLRLSDVLEQFSQRLFQVYCIKPEGTHHWNTEPSLVMPNGDPRDGFFEPTFTLTIDSYSICHKACPEVVKNCNSFMEMINIA